MTRRVGDFLREVSTPTPGCLPRLSRSVYLVGICRRDIKLKRSGDGDNLDVKQRVYRYDLPTSKLTPPSRRWRRAFGQPHLEPVG